MLALLASGARRVTETNSPSIVPTLDCEVYLVLDDLGKLGRTWREAGDDEADKETTIRRIAEGQYSNPVRVVAFNTGEGWARDVTEDVAWEMLGRAARNAEPLSRAALAFVEWATSENVPAALKPA